MQYTTLEQMYRSEIRVLPHPHSDEEELVFGCLGYILTVAETYAPLFPNQEYIDLVAIGNLAAVKHAGLSLTKNVPKSYLRGCIKKEIFWYCLRQRTTWEYRETDCEEGVVLEERDYTYLYEAIGKLSPKQREVVVCHFGLGVPKQSLYELS